MLFVDLAPIEDPSLVISTLASTLGLVLRANDPVAAIVEFLRDERVLIVLDNCEQVIDAVAGLADRILRETGETHMLITSREPLRIAGECVHRLTPLECPPVRADITAGEAKAYSAVQLFVERATASVGGFVLDDASALRPSPRFAGGSMEFHSPSNLRRPVWNSSASPPWPPGWTTCSWS